MKYSNIIEVLYCTILDRLTALLQLSRRVARHFCLYSKVQNISNNYFLLNPSKNEKNP
jgi:hypothetical protein